MMKKLIGVVVLGLSMVMVAQAHFVFVIPNADGTKASVVFSDTLGPDENVDIAKASKTTLTMRDSSGKETPLTVEKGKHELTAKLPGKGNRLVFGTTEYGVLQKGDSKPFRLKYHPKAIVGSSEGLGLVGKTVPIEINPTVKSGKVQFQVLVNGKPAEGLEVTVMIPGKEKSEKTKTNKEGWTEAYDAKGTYGLWTRHVETGAGELDGKKYEETRHYATLVVELK